VVLIGEVDAKYGLHFADVKRIGSRHNCASLLGLRVLWRQVILVRLALTPEDLAAEEFDELPVASY
jgi:hypothetical protein